MRVVDIFAITFWKKFFDTGPIANFLGTQFDLKNYTGKAEPQLVPDHETFGFAGKTALNDSPFASRFSFVHSPRALWYSRATAAEFDTMRRPIPNWLEGITEDDFEGPGEVVTKAQLSRLLGISHGAIEKAIKEGVPIKARGVRNLGYQIEVGTFFKWWIRYQSNLVERDVTPEAKARHKLVIAQMDKSERMTADIRRQTVTTAQARTVMDENRAIIIKHAKAMPAKIAPALVGISDAAQTESLVADAINSMFSDIRAED